MRAWILLILLSTAPLAAQPLAEPGPSRFEMRDQMLEPVASTSANDRFQLRSSLSLRAGGEEPLQGFGFALDMRLLTSDRGSTCPGVDDIFRDRFELPP